MAYNKTELVSLINSELATSKPIEATNHRTVDKAIVDEMFDAQSRADLLADIAEGTEGDFIFMFGAEGAVRVPYAASTGPTKFVELLDVEIIPEELADESIVYFDFSDEVFKAKLLSDFTISYNGVAVRDALTSLVGDDRLDAVAIKNLPSVDAVLTVNGIAPDVLGDVTIGTNDVLQTGGKFYVSALQVSAWDNKYGTPTEVRDALSSLSDVNRLDASAIKNLPTGGGALTSGNGTTANDTTLDLGGNITMATVFTDTRGTKLGLQYAANYSADFNDRSLIDKGFVVTNYLALAGGTLTGFLTLNADPTSALHAATKQYVDNLLVGLWDDRGNFSAAANLFPTTGGSGTAGAILKGDIWTIDVAGVLGGTAVSVGDTVRALVNTPGSTSTNWAIAEGNLGYTPLSNVLTSGRIFVGSAGNVAVGVALSGEASITSAGVLTVLNSAVIGKVLTGYASTTGTVAATDTILQAIGKLNGNTAALGTSYWKTAGSTSITAAVDVGGAVANTFTFNGTYTTNANNQYHNTWEPTITLRNTASDVFVVNRLRGSFVFGANTQTITMLELAGTVNVNSTSGAIVQGIVYNPTLVGTPSSHIGMSIAVGRVGIGTLTPSSSSILEVRHPSSGEIIRARWELSTSTGQIVFYNGTVNIFDINVGGTSVSPSSGAYRALLTTRHANGAIEFRTANSMMAGYITNTQLWGFGDTSATLPLSRMDSMDSIGWGCPTAALTVSTTLTALHATVKFDCTSGNLTCTLPSASTAWRRVYWIKKTDATANTLSVPNVDGATKIINVQGKGIQVQSDGVAWIMIGDF